MILWASKETPETRPENYWPCSAFRWTLQASRWTIGFVQQYQEKSTKCWNDSHTNLYEINVTKYWMLGSHHVYYDGPHCFFSIGPVHFCWGNWNCKKCIPDKK